MHRRRHGRRGPARARLTDEAKSEPAAQRPWLAAILVAIAIEAPRMIASIEAQRVHESLARLGLGHAPDESVAVAAASVLGFIALFAVAYAKTPDMYAGLAAILVSAHGLASTAARLRAADRGGVTRDLVARVEFPEGRIGAALAADRLSLGWLAIELLLPLVLVLLAMWLLRSSRAWSRHVWLGLCGLLAAVLAIVLVTDLASRGLLPADGSADELQLLCLGFGLLALAQLRVRPLLALASLVLALFATAAGMELAHGWKRTRSLCAAATMERSYSPEDRRLLLARGRQRLAALFGRLPERAGLRAAWICDEATRRLDSP